MSLLVANELLNVIIMYYEYARNQILLLVSKVGQSWLCNGGKRKTEALAYSLQTKLYSMYYTIT